MPLPQEPLRKIREILQQSAVFSSFLLSFLLIGLEELMEILFFSCPCITELNKRLIFFIFAAPALFFLALMCLVFRPCAHGWSASSAEANDDTQQICPKAFASCLIPPLMWIFILFFDGDYIACSETDWNGTYVFDNELNRSWCKPTNSTDTRLQVRKYIHESEIYGYIVMLVFSSLTIISVGIYDCKSGKCNCGPSQLCRNEGPVAVNTEQQVSGGSATAGQEQQASGGSATAGQEQQASGGSATAGQEQQASGGSATAGQEQQASGGSATAGQEQQASGGSATAGQEQQASGGSATAGQEQQVSGGSATVGQGCQRPQQRKPNESYEMRIKNPTDKEHLMADNTTGV